VLSDLLSPPALPSTPRPRTDLLIPSYVLERRDSSGAVVQRGIVGALDIRGTESGHVLRHTQVEEQAVALHGRLLRERGGSREPLLLAAPDLGAFRGCVEAAVRLRPDLVLDTPEGGEVRLWACDRSWTVAPPALGPLLLADGHHRLEAARRLYCVRPGAAAGRLPALVVDHARHPLRLSALHRVIPGLDLRRAVATVGGFAQVRPRRPAARSAVPSRGSFLLTGQGQSWEVSAISAALLASRLRWLPSEWVELDAAISDHVLIPLLCKEQGLRAGPSYTAARPRPGEVGLVLPSPTWNQVWSSAASGSGMPPKSTRLSPGPPPDLLAYLG
jgi:hypothetical protein